MYYKRKKKVLPRPLSRRALLLSVSPNENKEPHVFSHDAEPILSLRSLFFVGPYSLDTSCLLNPRYNHYCHHHHSTLNEDICIDDAFPLFQPLN